MFVAVEFLEMAVNGKKYERASIQSDHIEKLIWNFTG